jgi:hypothetical protein
MPDSPATAHATAGATDVRSIVDELAEDVLFPRAVATEASELVPLDLLDRFAAAGLYGMAGPTEAGGLAVPMDQATELVEILAAACLSSTFIWVQHHGAVIAMAYGAPDHLRDEWLGPLCRGEMRAGVALAGALSGPVPKLRARAVDGGWRLDGTSPWVTGWGRVDVLQVAARTPDDDLVWLLVDAAPSETLRVEHRPMVALDATGTVSLHVDGHVVPADRVIRTQPYAEFQANDAGGLRMNGSLSLGVARRCCALVGPTPLDDELAACREALDRSPVDAMPAARAAATELAGRASHAAIVAQGSGSILLDQHAQRLAREALFLLVFGSRPRIGDALLDRLGAGNAGSDETDRSKGPPAFTTSAASARTGRPAAGAPGRPARGSGGP